MAIVSTILSCRNPLEADQLSHGEEWCSIRLNCPDYITKGTASGSIVNDLNLMVFHNGETEYAHWSNIPEGHDMPELRIPLVKGRRYTFYALANAGRKIEVHSSDELEETYFEVSGQNLSESGCLMSALIQDVSISSGGTVSMDLRRMIAKISLSIDRSRLSEDVSIEVRKAVIGNSPKYIRAIGENRVETRFDRLEYGFSLNEDECMKLNETGQGGLSGEAALYMPENIQGEFPEEIHEDEEKTLDPDDPLAETASYIELWMRYNSSVHFSSYDDLIYRFYLGEGLTDLDVERNCHYHITVTPEDDGLSGSGWRVDKTGIGTYIREIVLSDTSIDMNYKGQTGKLDADILPEEASIRSLRWETSDNGIATVSSSGVVTAVGEGRCSISCTATDGSGCTASCEVNVSYAPPYFKMYPGSYVSGKVGDSIHVWCEFFPPNAPFDPGYEELDYDRSRGIYDYKMDEDGHGVTLYLKKPGTGIVFMSAGDPVNESGMTLVEVNP